MQFIPVIAKPNSQQLLQSSVSHDTSESQSNMLFGAQESFFFSSITIFHNV